MSKPYKRGKEHGGYGRVQTEETRRKISEARKGHPYYPPRGGVVTEETRHKIRLTKIGEKNPNWKGYDYQFKFKQYTPLHQWLRRRLPIPELCPECNIRPPYDLANITGIYNREFKNWQYLCRKCHMVSDGRLRNLEKGRMKKK